MELLKLKPCLTIFGILLGILSCAVISQAAGLSAAHHIQIELIPGVKKLIGQNDITIKPNGTEALEFRLSERATRIEVQINKKPRNFNFENGHLRLMLKPHERFAELQVSIHYAANFDDPVPVQPINMDNPGFGVLATISEKGSFLLAGAGWYPKLVNSSANYRVTVTAPSGLIAVTAGRSLGHRIKNGKTVSDWEVNYPVEGLSLSVARYVVERSDLFAAAKPASGGSIPGGDRRISIALFGSFRCVSVSEVRRRGKFLPHGIRLSFLHAHGRQGAAASGS
jgi:hypothetical protein